MSWRSRSLGVVSLLPLVLLFPGCASFNPGHGSQPDTPQPPTSAPVAYVYVGTNHNQGGGNPSATPSLEAFSAAQDGALTQIQTLGLGNQEQLIAANSSAVYTVDAGMIRPYPIQFNGALADPESAIDTQQYGGAQCGTPSGAAVMDRSGQFLTVELYGAGTESGGDFFHSCDTWQTYQLQPGGQAAFEGYDDSDPWGANDDGVISLTFSTVSGNNQFAYGATPNGYATQFTLMQRDSAGALNLVQNFAEVDPTPQQAANNYWPELVAADSSNHLAAAMYVGVNSNPMQLASYTIDNSTGAIASTNTYADMPPIPNGFPVCMAFSPAGDMVAEGGTNGLQLYTFNGANPPALYGNVLLPALIVQQVAWDSDHHLYVVANPPAPYGTSPQFGLYVFTVINTAITPVAGSPWNVPNGEKLLVVPQP